GFAVASKPDSHDICFIPDGDTRGFLARTLGSRPGPVVDAATGATVGEHDGTYGFTVGQRKGLGITVGDQRPRYVLGIEPVSRTVTIGTQDLAGIGEVRTGVPTWTGPAPAMPFGAQVQLRAHAVPVACEVAPGANGGLRITLAEDQRGVAPGQSAVLYEPDAQRGDRVLGQATVETTCEREEAVRH
ncbi:MAG TPA: tRNA methyl transferase PRC-barrel domain-containing protein, partial [Blastococcus sp.]